MNSCPRSRPSRAEACQVSGAASEEHVTVDDVQSAAQEKRIRRALGNAGLPQYVKSFRYEVGEDSNGEMALFVWVLLSDAAPNYAWKGKNLHQLTLKLRRSYNREAIASDPGWIYVYFRSVSEDDAVGGDVE